MRIVGISFIAICLFLAEATAQVQLVKRDNAVVGLGNESLGAAEFAQGVKQSGDAMLNDLCDNNSSWQDAGNGLRCDGDFCGARYLMELAGIGYTIFTDGRTRYLAAYDGAAWSYESVLDVDDNVGENALIAYKGELYAAGSWMQVGDLPGTGGIVKWTGSNWETVGGGIDNSVERGWINSLEVHNGKLYVGGTFKRIGGIDANNVAAFDGRRWEALGEGIEFVVADLHSHQGELYLGAHYWPAAEENALSKIVRWDGEKWHAMGASLDREVRMMASYGNDLYVHGPFLGRVGNETIRKAAVWDGSSWRPAGGDLERFHTLRDWITLGDRMYVSGYVAGGDHVNARYPGVAMFDGEKWTTLGVGNAQTWGMALIRGTLHVGGFFTGICDADVRYVAALSGRREQNALVGGRTFSDLNGNCDIDADDRGVARSIIKVEPGPIYTRSRKDGSYSLYLPPGNYTVSSEARPFWEQTCPNGADNYSLAIASPEEEHSGLNFGHRPRSSVEALDVSVAAAGALRPGRTVEYWIRYENVGTLPFNGSLLLSYDELLSFVVSDPAVSRHALQLLEWDLVDVPVGLSGHIKLSFVLPADESIAGRELCVTISSRAERPQDELSGDERDEFCREVTNAKDPNIISVAPGGVGDDGKITPDIDELAYTIRFQNTGSDTAFKVVIVDTLNHNLFNIGSLRIGAASHDFSFELSGSGILTWTFDNIMLPDSNSNEAASHGVVKYKVKLHSGLAVGTAIRNRAGIYFDFNKPVITNTALTTIASEATTVEPISSDLGIRLYPNPASEKVIVEADYLAPGSIVLRNALGQSIRQFDHQGGPTIQLALATLPPGSYLLTLPTLQGMRVTRILIVH